MVAVAVGRCLWWLVVVIVDWAAARGKQENGGCPRIKSFSFFLHVCVYFLFILFTSEVVDVDDGDGDERSNLHKRSGRV